MPIFFLIATETSAAATAAAAAAAALQYSWIAPSCHVGRKAISFYQVVQFFLTPFLKYPRFFC